MQPFTKNIFLVGLMGAGKTMLGKRLAKALGYGFVDTDAALEEAARLKVSEIFSLYGEPEFRRAEERIIARLLETTQKNVIASGGGAFLSPGTRQLALEKATVLWLKAEKDILLARVGRSETRPLLKGKDAGKVLDELIRVRYPLYSEAHLAVETYIEPVSATLKRTLEKLKGFGYGLQDD